LIIGSWDILAWSWVTNIVSMLLTSWSNKNQNSFEPCHNLEFRSDSLASLINSLISTLNAKFTAKYMGSCIVKLYDVHGLCSPQGRG
jgi:hypothetical protein